jgi:hypothetical protein
MTMRAVLYVCSPTESGAVDAEKASRHVATLRHFSIVDTIVDVWGEVVPAQRPGWQKLMQLADEKAFDRMVTYLPSSVSENPTRRYEALNGLAELGVRSLYSWPMQGPFAGRMALR